ncbi:hypothetical protein [Lutimonas sp.]|uniref:hypothetical protein n=1 Tax=Lutimonas sp. TaxID=1872403 RepID=UPI003D9B72D9
MRKLLRKSYPVFLLFLTLSFTDVKHDEGPTKLLGSWNYAAPEIGLKFQKGAIEFSFEEDVLKGNVMFHDRIIPMENLVYEEDKVRAHIIFEGEQIDIFLRFEMDSFKGTVSHPKGFLRISGNRIIS